MEKEPINHYVDIESIKKTFGEEPDIINEFMELFLKHFPSDIAKLVIAFDEKNMEQVFTISHNLKTTVSSLKRDTPLFENLRIIEKFRYKEVVDWQIIEENITIITNAEEKVLQDIKTLQKNLFA